MKITSKLISAAAGGLLLAIPASTFAAGTAGISVSGGGSYSVGTTFTTSVMESSTQAVNGVSVGVQYNTSLLQLVGTPAVGDFTTCPPNNGATVGSGSVSWQCVALGGKFTGTHTVGVLTFKVLAAGNTSVSTTSGTVITDATTNQNDWNGSSASANYSLSAAPASLPNQGSYGGSNPSSSNSSTNTQSGKKVTTSPTSTTGNKSTAANNSTSNSGSTSSDSSAVKGSSTTKSGSKVTTTPKVKTGHAGLIASWILGLLLAVIAVGYIFMARKAKPAEAEASAAAKNDVKAAAAKKVSETKKAKPASKKSAKKS